MEAIDLKPVGGGNAILKKKFGGWHQWEASVTAVNERRGREIG